MKKSYICILFAVILFSCTKETLIRDGEYSPVPYLENQDCMIDIPVPEAGELAYLDYELCPGNKDRICIRIGGPANEEAKDGYFWQVRYGPAINDPNSTGGCFESNTDHLHPSILFYESFYQARDIEVIRYSLNGHPVNRTKKFIE